MVLPISDEQLALYQDSRKAVYRAYAFYDGQQRLAEPVPITTDGSIRFDGDAVTQGSGSVFLARDQDSLIPKSVTDPLAPFGQELRIERVDFRGSKEFPVTMGQFRIGSVPSMKEYFRRYPSRVQTVGWSAQLNFSDRFDIIAADKFLDAESPKTGTVWSEIQRLSPIAIIRNDFLPDRDIPASLTAYPDSRMDAITQLFAILGAYPHLTRLGVLTGRPRDVWMTATVPVAEVAGVIDIDDSLTGDVYNAVKLSSSQGSNSLYATAQITDPGDPLRVNGPFGRRVVTQSTPLLNEQTVLDAGAITMLRRVSTRRSRTVKVECLPQPHLELGDYIRVTDPTSGRVVDGEIASFSVPLDGVAKWDYTLIVSEVN